jgi:hypothetical protein
MTKATIISWGLTSVTASHAVMEQTAVFFELVGVFSAESGSDGEVFFNMEMTGLVTPTWQFDGGVQIGLTGVSADFSPFLGMSTKI